jgi:hypothetical protein
MYLSDLAPQANIMNLETGELRSINSAAVKDRAPIGLRRYVLEESSGGSYRETGECMPMTEELFAELEDNMRLPNNWNYDWPHLQVEIEGDGADHPIRLAILERLNREMADHPYTFQVTGLQRRYLMYFSDGNYQSQQAFERYVPRPDSSPFRRDGSLRKKYNWIWNSNMRDAKVPVPQTESKLYGNLAPCLYTGPAWVVRFQLDGQDPLLERCRVYVTDEGEFICSDWCQRHDQTSYGDGINLQRGIYSFGAWVTGPCVTFASGRGGFKPTSTTFTRTAVKDLIKQHGLLRPPRAFDDVFAQAQKTVASFESVVPAGAPKLAHDAGDITAAAVAEAEAVADARLAEVGETLKLPEGVVPQSLRSAGLSLSNYAYFEVDLPSHKSGLASTHKRGVVGLKLNLDGSVTAALVSNKFGLPQEAYEALRVASANVVHGAFAVNADFVPGVPATNACPEFWYLGDSEKPTKAVGVEALKPWWLYDAAVYYRDAVSVPAELVG